MLVLSHADSLILSIALTNWTQHVLCVFFFFSHSLHLFPLSLVANIEWFTCSSYHVHSDNIHASYSQNAIDSHNCNNNKWSKCCAVNALFIALFNVEHPNEFLLRDFLCMRVYVCLSWRKREKKKKIGASKSFFFLSLPLFRIQLCEKAFHYFCWHYSAYCASNA